jgi:catechol 2,3-dioxygenase-like lactoylglutathione lyase family enzyme
MEVVEVIVYTRDMARATSFYRDVLGFEPDFESEHWTTFRTGACTLALHAGSQPPDPTSQVRSPTQPRSANGSSPQASR